MGKNERKEVSREVVIDSCEQSRGKSGWLVCVGVGEPEEGYLQ